jgi:hypothetical protein
MRENKRNKGRINLIVCWHKVKWLITRFKEIIDKTL